MSLTVVGYDEQGRRIVRDDGPAFARRQGYGGAAMGAFSGVKLTAHQRRDLAPRKRVARQALAGRRAAVPAVSAPRQAARKAVAG